MLNELYKVLVYGYIADGVKIGGQVLKVAEDNNVWWSIGTLGGITP